MVTGLARPILSEAAQLTVRFIRDPLPTSRTEEETNGRLRRSVKVRSGRIITDEDAAGAHRDDWTTATYRQASADWALFRETQVRDNVAARLALHVPHVATEKLARANRFGEAEDAGGRSAHQRRRTSPSRPYGAFAQDRNTIMAPRPRATPPRSRMWQRHVSESVPDNASWPR